MVHHNGKFSLSERSSVKIQLAVEVFKRVFVWTSSIHSSKVEVKEEEVEVEEHDVTSIPVGFHS